MAKPFFFRIDLVELLDFATEPEGETMSLLKFAKELKSGKSDYPAIQKIIDEANNYIEKKRNSGSSGGKARVINAQAKSSAAQAALKQKVAVLKPETEAVTETTIKDKTLSSSADEAEDFYLTKKRKKLKGKRLDTFNQFWAAFGKKEGKAEAADAWMEIPTLTEKIFSEILTAARRENEGRPKLLAAGKTPKMAQGWLTGRRWEDERQEVESWRLI